MPIYRRRPFLRRRRLTPLGRRPPRHLPPAARKALRHLKKAHKLMEEGQPAEAAAIFDELAHEASKRGIPRAPQLYLQAGRAWIEAGKVEDGMQRLQDGLKLMSKMEQLNRLQRIGQRILAELRSRGLTEQAAALEPEIQSILAVHGLSLTAVPGSVAAPRLPAKCRYCGGNVLPDEVEWVDTHRASCVYCGSLLEAEG